jgi:hypothetical protein
MIHLERVRCSGGLLDLVRTFHGMYRRLGVVHLMSLCFPAFSKLFLGIFMGACWSHFLVGFFVGYHI